MSEPDLLITPEAAWCTRHLRPYRAKWPQGYLPATLCLVHQACQRDDILAAAGADVAMLGRVLREFGPLCCLVGDEVTAAITSMAVDDDITQLKGLLARYGPPPTKGEHT